VIQLPGKLCASRRRLGAGPGRGVGGEEEDFICRRRLGAGPGEGGEDADLTLGGNLYWKFVFIFQI
jgi:hypothetical protein